LLLLFVLSSGVYFYYSAKDAIMDSLGARLSHSAALLSRAFKVEDLDQIQDKSDMHSVVYQHNVEILRRFSDSNADIAFIYVMRRIDDGALFVIDSDNKHPAIPGERYEIWLPELMAGFTQLSADKKINQDKWGNFLSGYAPIYGAQGQYLIGLDMRADDVVQKLSHLDRIALMSLIVFFFLSTFVSMLVARHFTHRLKTLTQQCADIIETDESASSEPIRKGDELDVLRYAFKNMSLQMQVRQQLNERAKLTLKKARDALKSIVQNRTEEQELANQKLLDEIEERKKIEDELERSAYSDYLTGLLNRRAMMRILEHEGKRTYHDNDPFCLIFIDLDHFKQINDEYGHDIGDKVLVHLTKQLSLLMRDHDVLSRWGGEEFLLLVPQTTLDDAMIIAEKLRYSLATHAFYFDQLELRVTASFGVSQHTDATSLDDSIRMADAAMYDAKRQGRNCIVSFIEHRKKDNTNSNDLHRRKPA